MGNDTTHFHDSETGDIYDLYNACDGVMRNGLLDLSKLESYSSDDSEVLNVQRLREVWEHTASGCFKCKAIVQTLNCIRGAIKPEVS